MHAIRQSCRPKHQLLVLKCYPKFQRNAVDVKPNSSELSYLLYYASTRRSKIHKVGAFLEQRVARDVWRGRLSNVQVTMQILRALIEKLSRDLPLYALSILRTLRIVLRSKDLTMVEYTVPTFDSFCAHHDAPSPAADQDYLRQYEEIVNLYASFTTRPEEQTRGLISAPVALRWRSVGLHAIKSIACSEILGSDGGRQLHLIMPVILHTLYSDDAQHLAMLQQRARIEEDLEGDKTLKRRMSNVTTVRTSEATEPHPATASGTAADADKLAEEAIGLLALQSLRQIFTLNSRGRIRTSTACLLSFVRDIPPTRGRLSSEETGAVEPGRSGAWGMALFAMVARWAAVQDRYVILVTAMEMLVRSPVVEDQLEPQLVLANLIGSLLSSDINLIGLSVMDVLIGLIQHILLLLQLGGQGSAIQPHRQQRYAVGAENAAKDVSRQPSPVGLHPRETVVETVTRPTTARIELLGRLERCIGELATHIYYSDQISDMISAILLRLKPSPLSAVQTTAGAIEHPTAAARAISASVRLRESDETDAFFSFETARVIGLKAIKRVFTVANLRKPASATGAVSRNRVGAPVWEGTQWLLRDPDGRVRKTYVDALCTWLTNEVDRHDLRMLDSGGRHASRPDHAELSGASLAKRAVSSTSQRDKAASSRSTFLQLLHLAIYENALCYAMSTPDLLLLHTLLATLVNRMGISAVCSSLPMILRLQEDLAPLESPVARIQIGSLIFGHLWVLSETFEFESSATGVEIHREVVRRQRRGLWLEVIRVPPMRIEQIATPSDIPEDISPPTKADDEVMQPFTDRQAIVRLISTAYVSSFDSPPGSAPSSPGRKHSVIHYNPMNAASPVGSVESKPELPPKMRDDMLSNWSRESVIATCAKHESRSVSLNGSGRGTNRSGLRNQYLTVSGVAAPNGDLPPGGTDSPTKPVAYHHHSLLQHHHGRPRSRQNATSVPVTAQDSRSASTAGVNVGATANNVSTLQRLRQASQKPSPRDASPVAGSSISSSRTSIVRVSDLKAVLAGRTLPSSRSISRGRLSTLPRTGSIDDLSSPNSFQPVRNRDKKDDKNNKKESSTSTRSSSSSLISAPSPTQSSTPDNGGMPSSSLAPRFSLDPPDGGIPDKWSSPPRAPKGSVSVARARIRSRSRSQSRDEVGSSPRSPIRDSKIHPSQRRLPTDDSSSSGASTTTSPIQTHPTNLLDPSTSTSAININPTPTSTRNDLIPPVPKIPEQITRSSSWASGVLTSHAPTVANQRGGTSDSQGIRSSSTTASTSPTTTNNNTTINGNGSGSGSGSGSATTSIIKPSTTNGIKAAATSSPISPASPPPTITASTSTSASASASASPTTTTLTLTPITKVTQRPSTSHGAIVGIKTNPPNETSNNNKSLSLDISRASVSEIGRTAMLEEWDTSLSRSRSGAGSTSTGTGTGNAGTATAAGERASRGGYAGGELGRQIQKGRRGTVDVRKLLGSIDTGEDGTVRRSDGHGHGRGGGGGYGGYGGAAAGAGGIRTGFRIGDHGGGGGGGGVGVGRPPF